MKTIAVWGNHGSGKSLVSTALGNLLTKSNKSVIVLSCDKNCPMFPIFLPFKTIGKEQSAGQIFQNAIEESTLKNRIQLHHKNDNLGFICMAQGDNVLRYQGNWNKDSVSHLQRVLEYLGLADYLIIDCTQDIFTDAITLYALEYAQVIRVISPDTRGISFLESQAPILLGGDFKPQQHIRVLNNAYSYSPVKQLKQDYDYHFVLPHCKDAYTKYIAGDLVWGLYNRDGEEFERVLKEIAGRVR